jgi:hypothetical protein
MKDVGSVVLLGNSWRGARCFWWPLRSPSSVRMPRIQMHACAKSLLRPAGSRLNYLGKVGSPMVAKLVFFDWACPIKPLILLPRPRGFKPLTFALGGQRSEPAYTDAGAPLAFARSGEQGGSRKSIPSTSPSSRKFYRAPSSSVLRAPIPAIAANTTGGVGPPPYCRKARARHHRHKHDRLCSDSPICRCPFPWRQNEGRAAVPGRGPWSATNSATEVNG